MNLPFSFVFVAQYDASCKSTTAYYLFFFKLRRFADVTPCYCDRTSTSTAGLKTNANELYYYPFVSKCIHLRNVAKVLIVMQFNKVILGSFLSYLLMSCISYIGLFSWYIAGCFIELLDLNFSFLCAL